MIEHEDEDLGCIERDQIFAASLLRKLIETYDNSKYVSVTISQCIIYIDELHHRNLAATFYFTSAGLKDPKRINTLSIQNQYM